MNVQTQRESRPVRDDSEWIARATEVLEAAARGNFEARLTRVDASQPVARLLRAINDMLDVTDGFVREAGASLDAAKDGRFSRKVLTRGFGGDFVRAADLINAASADLREKRDALTHAQRERVGMADEFEDEVGGVVRTVNAAAGEVGTRVDEISGQVTETLARATSVAAAAEEVSAAVTTVASAAEQLDASAREIKSQARASTESAVTVTAEAREARNVLEQLREESAQIGSVVGFIRDVAMQTNLLSLNAAIEAARAGDAGRGFAVVAHEVKNLAGETAKATDRIETQVRSLERSIGAVVERVAHVTSAIEGYEQTMFGIEQAVAEQEDATREISVNAHQVAEASREVSENMAVVTRTSQCADESRQGLEMVAARLGQGVEQLDLSASRFISRVRSG